eukprot:11264327-Alexandrium_andersonii.AAC.1
MVVKPEVADERGSLAVDAVGIRHRVERDHAKLGILASDVGMRPVWRHPIVRHALLEHRGR